MATSTTRPSTLEDFYTQPKEYALDPAISNYWTPDRLMADYARKPFTPKKMEVNERYISPVSSLLPINMPPSNIVKSHLHPLSVESEMIYDGAGRTTKHMLRSGRPDEETTANDSNVIYQTDRFNLPIDTGVNAAGGYIKDGRTQHYAPGGAIGGNFGDPRPAPFAGVPSAFSGVQAPTSTSSTRSRSSGLSTPATRSSSMGQNNHREVDTYVAPQPMFDVDEDSSSTTTTPATTATATTTTTSDAPTSYTTPRVDAAPTPDTTTATPSTATSTPTFYTAPTVGAAPSALLQPGNNRVVTPPPPTVTQATPEELAELHKNKKPIPEGQRGAYNVGTEGVFYNEGDRGYEGVDPNEAYRTGDRPGEYRYYNHYANGPYQGMFFADGGMAEMPDDMGEMGEMGEMGMPPGMPPDMQGGGLPDGFAAQLQHALQALTSQNQESGDSGGSGGSGGRYLKGPGDGMSDEIPAAIDGQAPAALSDGEFVISADVVSGLGNGSSDAGAKVLHKLMDRVRLARTGNTEQAKKVNPEKLLPKIRG